MKRRHAQRGQVLPLWIAAIVSALGLMFLAVNYGNTLRWQMRAQNAADGAAQALMAIQTQHFNELTATLYTANVEEFRARLLLDGMLQALNGAGGCGGQPRSGPVSRNQTPFITGSNTCDQVFSDMLGDYEQSVNRYSTDVLRVNDVAVPANYTNWLSDVTKMTAHLDSASRCNDVSTTAIVADGGDCQFKYTLNGAAYRTHLNAVSADAYIVFVPAQGFTLNNNTETENSQFFGPGMVDVVVCAKVPPLIASIGTLNAKPHYVIGRAGAAAVLTEEDWFQPGTLIDPARGTSIPFQPKETYTNADVNLTYDWYGVKYGGNAWQIGTFPDPVIPGKIDSGYTSAPTINDFSAYVGWWGAIPYDPRKVDSNTISTTTVCPP